MCDTTAMLHKRHALVSHHVASEEQHGRHRRHHHADAQPRSLRHPRQRCEGDRQDEGEQQVAGDRETRVGCQRP